MRCGGSGGTDNTDPCTREGGEISKVISTAGVHGIQVSYDLRVNSLGKTNSGGCCGCAPDHDMVDEQLTVFYSTNAGTTWTEAGYVPRAILLNYQTFGTRTLDLSSVAGCNNNPSFALRFRWQLNTTGDTADLDNIIVRAISDDATPPAPVTNFTAASASGHITLNWRNPSDSDYAGTAIVYRTTGYPTSVADGTPICYRAAAPSSSDSYTHTSLTNGIRYYYSAFAYDRVLNYSSAANTATAPAIEATIQAAKSLADGQIRLLKGKVVSSPFAGCFYIHEPGSAGIGWGIKAISSASVSAGNLVDVVGAMGGAGSERYIDCTGNCVIVTTPGPGSPTPLGMVNSSVGGVALNPLTPGVTGGFGLNNIGLLVVAFGRVTEIEQAPAPAQSTWFKIDDGSGVYLKCLVPAGVVIDQGWQYVRVTGVSSCEMVGGGLQPLLRVRSLGDIVPILP